MTPVRRRRFAWISDAFVIEGRLAWQVLVGFVLINLVVLTNAMLHDPKIGYDASAHLKYATTLAKNGWLPTDHDTHEFFSPPLPYLPTALLWATLDAAGRDGRAEWALKLAQLVQAGYSVVLTFVLIKLARLVRGGGWLVPTCALACLGAVPAYYRTFAMIRGEPLLATLALLGTYLAIRTFALRRPTVRAALLLGLTLGLAVLSRQWAFFLLPALGLIGLWRLIVDGPRRVATIRAGLVVLVTSAVVGLPFYVHLQRTYGSMRAFNRTPEGDGGSPVEPRALGLANAANLMVTHPVRDVFAGHPLLLFYADVWGDYWDYYLVYAKDRAGHYVRPAGAIGRTVEAGKAKSNNYASMSAYLGRTCAVGAIPTAFALAGTAGGMIAIRRLARRGDGIATVLPTLSLSVICTVAGYAWFVMSYPSDEGDTIKASYPLQLYAPLAILAASVIGAIATRWPRAGKAMLVVLVVVALHNLPAGITRYR